MLKKFPFTLFLPVFLLVASLHAEEDPVGYQTKSSTTDFYFAVGAEYSSSVIEIEQMDLTVDYSSSPEMEVDYLNNAQVENLHPSLKIGYRLPFIQSLSIEGGFTAPHTVKIGKSSPEQLFQSDKLDPFWSDSLDELSTAFGAKYAFTDVLLSGALAEVDVFSPQLTMVYHPQVKSRFKPLVGLGIHYLTFSNFKITEENLYSEFANGPPSGSIQNVFGWLAHLGFEYDLTDRWLMGAEFKYSYVNGVKISLDDLYIPIGKLYASEDSADSEFLYIPTVVTSADARLNIRTTTFSFWAGFSF